MRTLSDDAVAALAADEVAIAALVHIQFDSHIYSCTSGDISYGGDIYLCNTGLVKIPKITQDFNLSTSSISLDFNDADESILAEILANGYYKKQMDIHLAILDASDRSVIQVIESIYRGYCTAVKPIKYSGVTRMTFKNHAIRFDKTAGHRTNTASQQRHYPDDTTMDYVTSATGDRL